MYLNEQGQIEREKESVQTLILHIVAIVFAENLKVKGRGREIREREKTKLLLSSS